MLFLAFPDRNTPLFLKILAFLFWFVPLSFPALCFYFVHLWRPSAITSRRPLLLAATALLFFLTWLSITPLVIASVRSDALGGLSLLLGPLLHIFLWIVCGVALLFVKKQPA
jgi:hypothetical protein